MRHYLGISYFPFPVFKEGLAFCSSVMGGVCEERNGRKDGDVENNCKCFTLYFNNYLPGKIFSA